jgi:hypothetical protein
MQTAALATLTPSHDWTAERDYIVSGLSGKSLIITARGGADRASQVVKQISHLRKALKQSRVSITQPIDRAKKAIMAKERELMEDLDALDEELRKQLSVWQRAQEAKARAAEAAAREAAAEAAAKAAAENADPEAIAEAAEAAMAEAPVVAAPGRPSDATFVTTYKYEVVEAAQIPVGYLKPDPTDGAMVRARLKALDQRGQALEIPGLRCWCERTARIR